MFASTLTSGRISAGNRTFLIRFPPEISEPADSVSDDENQVQGRMPQNMNSANGSGSREWGAGRTTANTKLEISRNRSGLMKDQKKPRTDPRYRAFSSRATRLWIRPR